MTAVSISLPTIGRDLNIVEAKLQWIISAYSLSSVSLLLSFFSLPFVLTIVGAPGMPSSLHGKARRLIWPQDHLHVRMRLHGHLRSGLWLCPKSVLLRTIPPIFNTCQTFPSDEITMDILRALQGIGPAASVPAAVSPYMLIAHARALASIDASLVAARYPCAHLPSFAYPLHRLRDLFSGRTRGCCYRAYHRRYLDRVYRVRLLPSPLVSFERLADQWPPIQPDLAFDFLVHDGNERSMLSGWVHIDRHGCPVRAPGQVSVLANALPPGSIRTEARGIGA